MGAIIDRDHIDADAKGRTFGYDGKRGLQTNRHVRFRLLDDDGEVYYTGRIDYDDVFGEDADDDRDLLYDMLKWAEADAGCTDAQVRGKDCPTDFVQRHEAITAGGSIRCTVKVGDTVWVSPYS